MLIGWDSLLVLDFSLHVLDRIAGFDFQGDGLAGKGLDEDLHATTETEDQMEGRLLLDVVVGECATVFQLLAGEDQALLIGRDTFLVLDLGLDIFDRVAWFDFESDRLAGEGLDEDLHATTETEDQMKGRLLLNVVVRQGSAVFKLLAGEDQALLIGWDSFLVLDLGLHVLDRVTWLDFEGDRLAGEGLDEDLHATTETEHQVER